MQWSIRQAGEVSGSLPEITETCSWLDPSNFLRKSKDFSLRRQLWTKRLIINSRLLLPSKMNYYSGLLLLWKRNASECILRQIFCHITWNMWPLEKKLMRGENKTITITGKSSHFELTLIFKPKYKRARQNDPNVHFSDPYDSWSRLWLR